MQRLTQRTLRTAAGIIVLLTLLFTLSVQAQDDIDTSNYEQTLTQMLDAVLALREDPQGDPRVFEEIAVSADPLYIAPLVDLGYFLRGQHPIRTAIYDAIQATTGEDFGGDWVQYFEYAGREDITLPPGYAAFKGRMLAEIIDPRFMDFFGEGVQDTSRVNLAEVVWGGVSVDGIPSLVNARQITPEEAAIEGEDRPEFCRAGNDCRYPAPEEYVFGVSINGDSRAYPLRLLNWHEMFNDVIGHTPLYPDAESNEIVCNFRAPTPFIALARHGDTRVLINGRSAGCPGEGWLSVDALVWEDTTWDSVRDSLPDVSAGEEALSMAEGIRGSVQGMPVMLAYCTLCGSGVLYDATVPDLRYTDMNGETVDMGTTVLEFGSTGMLMRSNKLMYDRNTNTVWNALTGEPAFGPLATSDVQLTILPVVISDWASWLEEHPDTSVLSLETGFRRNYTNGAAYSDYFNNPDFIMFPVWRQDTTQQENKEMVYGLYVEGIRKAYPLDLLIPERVSNDTIGETDVVLVTRPAPERAFFEPGGAAIRAYITEGLQFSPGENDNEVLDANGNVWKVTESALVGPDGRELRRLGGHLAFWFGWYAYFPDTLVYEGAA